MISTIIFGNGIGMELDPNYFLLETGLRTAWDSFSENEKRIISLGSNTMPASKEGELERHHVIMTACQKLITHENNNLLWLSPEGKDFPNLYQNFIYKTAKHFFDYRGSLPSNFIDGLIKHIGNNNRCNIATLNYDKLLYKPLIDRQILSGYQDDGLVDGIHNVASGFSPENLLRIYYNFGWYLHLHGSPVFRTSGTTINKSNLNSLPTNAVENDAAHNHIVLAKTDQKPEIISNSVLLGAYFEFFTYALYESDALYIIGYNGLDKHVNFEIKKWVSTKVNKGVKSTIKIIERKDSGHKEDFWVTQLLPERRRDNINQYIIIQLEQLPSILDYGFT